MGITWRFTMVLLSTLAALVIIVHSAEEDYEAQYNRREMRPRFLDTGTRRYEHEQPWRTMKEEPIKEPSTTDSLIEDVSSEEPPRRRRMGRKRKRWHDIYMAEEEPHPHDIYFPEEPRSHANQDEAEQEEIPKRRRKKMERRIKYTDSVEEDRPVRRRGQRRKRPKIEDQALVEFSEVVNMNYNQKPEDGVDDRYVNNQETRNYGGNQDDETDSKYNNNRQDGYDSDASNEKVEVDDDQNKRNKTVTSNEEYNYRAISAAIYKDRINQKLADKAAKYQKMIKAAKDNGPVDPFSLKDILKRSNGSSLSEILQQHNLSLNDLLHGKEMALSILKSEEPVANESLSITRNVEEIKKEEQNTQNEDSKEEKLTNSETKYVNDIPIENTNESDQKAIDFTTTEIPITTTTEKVKFEEENPRNFRRFSPGLRRKQYIRPVVNDNYKSPLNRDLIALNANKFFNRRRNATKGQQWRDVLPILKNNSTVTETTEKINLEITTLSDIDKPLNIEVNDETPIKQDATQERTDESAEPKGVVDKLDLNINQEPDDDNISNHSNVDSENVINTQTPNTTSLRRPTLTNAQKKKRRKFKPTTTESPQDDIIQNLFGSPNIVSSSEYVAKSQEPKSNFDDDTMLEDFITTARPILQEAHRQKHVRISSTVAPKVTLTEDTAKVEIEEILNDTRVSAKLSKILMERNMTLSELVEHRERGSSYVHLADIFHNTSREPNPPEPFLSKSLIEPISKETYPLRALLDANIHDTTTKATTIDPYLTTGFVNIPGKMDFGNNVNENAENMGIMSLFHKIKQNTSDVVESTVMKDSEGTPYKSSIIVVNATEVGNTNDSNRHSRNMNELSDNKEDLVTWNEIFAYMRKNYENQTKELKDGLVPAESIKKTSDTELDELIVLDDLRNNNDLKFAIESTTYDNFDFETTTDESDMETKIPSEIYLKTSGILNKIPNHTRSVTLATACIVGLAMVLFLLSYLGYKWKQQSNLCHKRNFAEEQIPSPVFENRKGHKNNNSTRSISPMLTSNIYTLSTLDSQNGKESPDYMWDSLRKPFQ